MESRKEALSMLKQCRFCLSKDDTLTSLYKRNRVMKNVSSLPLKILSCLSIEVYPSDKMPRFICNRCKFFIDIFYEFKTICRQADENILHYIENATPLGSISWPSSLVKIFRAQTKPSEVAVMKTVVESGATVQVTAQDISDTDMEDDENVYNIKISDGSDDGTKSARIKVITGSDKEDSSKIKPKRVRKDSQDRDKSPEKGKMIGIDEGCWACDECDCTYPLQQLLELHKMQKHRFRNAHCDQCDAKFFTKYDLAIHQLRHSSETLYQCVVCEKRFKRQIVLKRHEKLVHSDLPQRSCPKCPASFLTLEQLEAHQEKHVLVQPKPYACSICDKRFPTKSSVDTHKVVMHEQKPTYQCEYCPERHATVSKLARHVRSHASDRSYPCKYCNKSFLKSHHYTRHLRVKHREIIRSRRGPFDEQEHPFRCDPCEDSFSTQDELIYHSAIHATQNLICPLCQEKFDDVDAVTSHIKSHVTSTEFMCDYCELIFTTKEKLDNHIATVHDDELQNDELEQESSMEVDGDDDDEDNAINLTEENGEMIVQIKKPEEFTIKNCKEEIEDRVEVTNSEESENEISYTDLVTVEPTDIVGKQHTNSTDATVTKLPSSTVVSKQLKNIVKIEKNENQIASAVKKVEEVKKKVEAKTPEPALNKKEKPIKMDNNNTGASDKSLRLLEKELQDLKRTNSRTEIVKIPIKNFETVKGRRQPIHTSTPKARSTGGKEAQQIKPAVSEKKIPERRLVTKENKEPKEVKESKNNNVKEDKDKEPTEKETTKEKNNIIKNGSSEKNVKEERVRRSTRPCKIKDYAKLIRDSSQEPSETDEDSDEQDEDDDDEEFKEVEKIHEPRLRQRRVSVKQPPAPKPAAPTVITPPRKRGRPRKNAVQQVPNKVKKLEDEKKPVKTDVKVDQDQETTNSKDSNMAPTGRQENENKVNPPETVNTETSSSTTDGLQSAVPTLKKVPIKALPPGVKPMPLPANARLGSGEVCEMQIGKKMVKVQKIVMTKAEVEAMTKKGLVELKDGTMVLKQGVSPAAVKSTLVSEGESEKESLKKNKATPSRCDLGDDV